MFLDVCKTQKNEYLSFHSPIEEEESLSVSTELQILIGLALSTEISERSCISMHSYNKCDKPVSSVMSECVLGT